MHTFFVSFLFIFCLPPSRNSDPGSHTRLFSLPVAVRALHFYREKISVYSFRAIINTSYQKSPFGSGDDPDKLSELLL